MTDQSQTACSILLLYVMFLMCCLGFFPGKKLYQKPSHCAEERLCRHLEECQSLR